MGRLAYYLVGEEVAAIADDITVAAVDALPFTHLGHISQSDLCSPYFSLVLQEDRMVE